MNKQFFAPILLAILCFACNDTKVYQQPQFEILEGSEIDSATSFYQMKEEETSVHNNYFKVHEYSDINNEVQKMVLKVEEHITANQHMINISPKWSKKPTKNWTIHSNSSNFDLNKNVLTLSYPPTEETEGYFESYNIYSGETLLFYTYGQLEAFLPNGFQKRMFGFTSLKSPELVRQSILENNKNIGFFTYASDEKNIQTIALQVKEPFMRDSVDKSTPVMEFIADSNNDHLIINSGKGLYLSGESDNNDLSFSIVTTFFYGKHYETLDVVFHVKNDGIQMENIEYDPLFFDIEVF